MAIKGDVTNEAVRWYKPEFFKYYNSHTKSDSAGVELTACDIVPFWKRWPILGAGLCFSVVILMLVFSGASVNPMKTAQASVVAVEPLKEKPVKPLLVLPKLPADLPASAVVPVVAASAVVETKQFLKNPQYHPFEGVSLHIIAFLEGANRWRYTFAADQNGQPVFIMTQKHLEDSGYSVEKLSECSAKILYKEISFYAVCDTRSVAVARSMVGNQ